MGGRRGEGRKGRREGRKERGLGVCPDAQGGEEGRGGREGR